MKLIKIIKKEIIIICIFFFTVIIDQITKFYIYENKFYFFEGVKLYSWLNLVYVENQGISFGILSELNISFYLGIISTLVSFYIFYLIKKSDKSSGKIALSLILGGAIGNGIDRIKVGYVIDFIDVHVGELHWPVFNFADSFITVGGVLYFWLIFFNKNH
jgi:signal peptidase II